MARSAPKGSRARKRNSRNAAYVIGADRCAKMITSNPISDVRKPTKPQPYDRLPTLDEIEVMQISAGENLKADFAKSSF
ncbi:hypothetical protein [Phaeobacter sp. C3_T13_0]|uniref:hypothetical protein n=1 Tax=Phaeobacter cretensis TaxID=3342641 RepID=UPI0039BD9131